MFLGDIKALRNENVALRTNRDALKKAVSELEQRLADLEQYSRNRNIEIKGLPVVDREVLPTVLQKMSDVLEEPITKDDIDKCHRVRTRNSSCPNVVVQFWSRAKRDAVLQKARKTKMTARSLGYNENNAVYVNENLCPYLKRLMGKTIAQKKDKAWRFVWTKDG